MGVPYIAVLPFITCLLLQGHCQTISQCSRDAEDDSCVSVVYPNYGTTSKDNILPRIDPGQVGDVRILNLVPGKQHRMITKARHPPIFEIADFLSSEECDYIQQAARAVGLKGATMFGSKGDYAMAKGALGTRKGEVTFVRPGKHEQLRRIQKRVAALTHMPLQLVEDSEPFQVGLYGVGGHYHSHYDSSRREDEVSRPCCQNTLVSPSSAKCKLCRYITVLLYLNDVEEGGETAFPVADTDEEISNKHINLTGHCHQASVVVKPQKGKAVMWYNNYRDPETGWIGRLDLLSFHGGCPVVKGHKWISNVWINAPEYENRFSRTVYSSTTP